MVCHVRTHLRCPDDVNLGCLEGESDEACIARTEPLEAECDVVETRLCVPGWSLLCDSDSPCVDGFQCESGSCQPVDRSCDTSADCPGGWLCREGDGGHCREGPDCIGGQTKVIRCVPPPH